MKQAVNKLRHSYDIVIVGAGIMGLCVARALKKQQASLKIAILEKEATFGLHASGRNSGVLHSGIYYKEDSLKARFCREGAQAMRAYCNENKLAIKSIGKIILPTKPNDEPILQLLHQRALKNGANAYLIDQTELKKLEPQAYSACNLALFTPDTSVVDPKAILSHLYQELDNAGVQFYFNSSCTNINSQEKKVVTNKEVISYAHLFNTAGLYADTIAKYCGLEDRYSMLPFKGIYYALKTNSSLKMNHLLYPVPDLNVPFLGIHTTIDIQDKVYLGPTAIPAFGRENYGGLKGVKLSEAIEIAGHLGSHYLANKQGFRRYAHSEMPRLIKSEFLKSARALIPHLREEDIIKSAKVGIRAQLIDKKNKELVMDFLIAKTENETHILNAVSPAFTSAISFSDYVVNELKV